MAETRGITELRRAGIEHRVLRYTYTGEGPAAGEAARELDVEPGRMVKSLVVVADAKPVFALLAADAELSLKKLAAAAGTRRAAMAGRDVAERRTGYQIGGISPLGSRDRLRVFLDDSAAGHERICLNAGGRGVIVEVPTAALVEHTGAVVAPLRRDQS
jgi:Cys-tRNA(Pro)/Cys-tRNA(Cys) deacylase